MSPDSREPGTASQENPLHPSEIRPRSRLRTRMAISYVAVTLVIVLLLESLVVGMFLYIVTVSPVTGYWALQGAENTAEIFALQAAVYATDDGLSPATTFEPGQPASLSLHSWEDSRQENIFHWSVPYVEPGGEAPGQPAIALLIDPQGRVRASSYPDRYPVSTNALEALPEDRVLIRDALAGKPNGVVHENLTSRYASVAQTVWRRDKEPVGAVYILAPAGGPPDTNLLPEMAAIIIPSGIGWLCLMLPIGLVFGGLTTRGLIRRIERLAAATARFKDGDTAIHVPVGRADEIGQLESQFNAMAGQLLESFAQRQALAEQSARREERARIEQEMSSAHYIQKSLLPEQAPVIPGWDIRARYNPARKVGGDLYDFQPLPGGRTGIVIGDATGKGVPSALIMATTCAMLRAAAPGADSPGRVLTLVNNLLERTIPSGTFATCFYAILDPMDGRLQYANAGHNLPYLFRDGEIIELRARGLPLGLMPEQQYAEGEVILTSQDFILFYTDGLVEAHDPQGKMYGADRLIQRIHEGAGAEDLLELLLNDLRVFSGSEDEQEDDVTLVMLSKIS